MKNNFSGETILIVDDEEDIREILGSYFERTGANILLASNGKEALDVVLTTPVGVIISDICMPELDGEELLRLFSHSPHAGKPFFFISGNAEISTESSGITGASGIFAKPFVFDEIDQAVGKALGLSA